VTWRCRAWTNVTLYGSFARRSKSPAILQTSSALLCKTQELSVAAVPPEKEENSYVVSKQRRNRGDRKIGPNLDQIDVEQR